MCKVPNYPGKDFSHSPLGKVFTLPKILDLAENGTISLACFARSSVTKKKHFKPNLIFEYKVANYPSEEELFTYSIV